MTGDHGASQEDKRLIMKFFKLVKKTSLLRCVFVALIFSSIFLILNFTTITKAQEEITFIQTMSFNNYDLGKKVIETSDGGYAWAGIKHTDRLDPFGQGAEYVFLIKTNSLGIEEWSRKYNRNCGKGSGGDGPMFTDFIQTSDNGYLITIVCQDTYHSSILIKTDEDGLVSSSKCGVEQECWVKDFEVEDLIQLNPDARIMQVKETADGYLFAANINKFDKEGQDGDYYCVLLFKKDKQNVYTKGDALTEFDIPVKKEQIIGKVIAKQVGEKLVRFSRFKGLFISRICLVAPFCYPALRLLKKGIRRYD